MDGRGGEGELVAVGARTGPGLGVSTNKAPLAHLPARWHAEHGNRNQFTPRVSGATSRALPNANAFAHTFYTATHPLSGSRTIPILMHMTHKHADTGGTAVVCVVICFTSMNIL